MGESSRFEAGLLAAVAAGDEDHIPAQQRHGAAPVDRVTAQALTTGGGLDRGQLFGAEAGRFVARNSRVEGALESVVKFVIGYGDGPVVSEFSPYYQYVRLLW